MLVIDLNMLEGMTYLDYELRTFSSGLEDMLGERVFGRFKGGWHWRVELLLQDGSTCPGRRVPRFQFTETRMTGNTPCSFSSGTWGGGLHATEADCGPARSF